MIVIFMINALDKTGYISTDYYFCLLDLLIYHSISVLKAM